MLATALLASATVLAEPTCSKVSEALVGVGLGQIRNYPDGLRQGIVREGTAEVIAGAGFESLEGESDSIVYPRIMAFFDRGKFTSVVAVGAIRRHRDHGYAQIVQRVALAANASYSAAGGAAVFSCEAGIELTVKPTSWEGKEQVKVQLADTRAVQRTREFIKTYCSDPSRRRPQDACK